MKILENRILIFLLRLILGGLFIYASWGKLLNPEDFGRAIRGYDMLPLGTIGILSVLLPYLEFFSGLFLIIGIFKRGSAFIILAMLVIFLGVESLLLGLISDQISRLRVELLEKD